MWPSTTPALDHLRRICRDTKPGQNGTLRTGASGVHRVVRPLGIAGYWQADDPFGLGATRARDVWFWTVPVRWSTVGPFTGLGKVDAEQPHGEPYGAGGGAGGRGSPPGYRSG